MAAAEGRTSGNRRRAAIAVAAIATAAALLGCGSSPSRPTVANALSANQDVYDTRPNILLFITDDQDLSSMPVMASTLRYFGEGGTDFSEARVSTPVCCPSRATMYSGLYAHNHGIKTNHPDEQIGTTYLPEETFPALLGQSGYATGQFGKYLNNWKDADGTAGFDVFENDYLGAAHDRERRGAADDITARHALQFLDDQEVDDSQPWLAVVSLRSPHVPLVPARRYADAQVPPFEGPPSFAETGRGDEPLYLKGKPAPRSIGLISRRYAQYERTLLSADDAVGSVMGAVQANGEEPNTLAVFISDNGYLFGEHDIVGKSVPYQESVRVPMYIRWPGMVPAGDTDSRLVGNVDLAPTFYDVAGIDPGYEVDGRSLFSPDNDRQYFLTESYFWRAIQDRDGSVIETDDPETGKPFVESYDWRTDPYELHGKPPTDDPAAVERFAEMQAALAQYAGCRGADCP